MEIREPRTEEELSRYYDLRWRILREPWGQPRGSEKDALEPQSIHAIALEGGEVIGVGRVHFNSPSEAQVRFMAVEERVRGSGVGSAILELLETKARERGALWIVLDARKSAAEFYESRSYTVRGQAHVLFGSIPHLRMEKALV